MIKVYRHAWLKPYIDMDIDLRKKLNNDFEVDLLQLMNNTVFVKTKENVIKHRDNKLFTTERRNSYLLSGPNYHSKTFSTEHLLAVQMKRNISTYE